ncbi:Putative glycosyl transferase group 1 [Acidithiobacillus ferrivorans]|uniref:Glycosyl transferase group 1 n=1 Tax=Acidithiobacillus ferrivorans TaxID=160808 RepID=A0A060URP0_9PROT|nr:glycosyltransferase family 1 protein [Acidithiobacillus ferrivorans]CDQ11297.1 Glycosyl transferase group 1 [Acidithiobacillus ferrivorans]SMH67656.1 Putative glycosyl transferase group 1 [Acidithiobacillus ferrivorans]
MKVLIVGNYPLSDQKSMHRYADLLVRALEMAGIDVRLIRPTPVFGRLKCGDGGISKWLGYIDRFLLFPPLLRWRAMGFDVVHIADQGNGMYASMLGNTPSVVTCHDMLAIRSALGEVPENPLQITGRFLQRWILRGLKRAAHVVCVSQQTQREWLRIGLPAQGSTSVVPNALNYPYRPMGQTERKARLDRLGVGDVSYILHVGSNNWYKNRPGLARIFDALTQHDTFRAFQLVVAGKTLKTEVVDWLQSQGHGARLIQTGPVDDEDLRALYSGAALLLFPSLQEGFGWPIVEAQACGCLVATTNRAPMTEVGGQGAIYFNVPDAQGAAVTIAAAWGDRDALVGLGFENANQYTTEALISGYMNAYRSVRSGDDRSEST